MINFRPRHVALAAALLATAALLALPGAALAAKKKAPGVRIKAKTFFVKVAEHDSGNLTIPYEQRTSNTCKNSERAIGMGIVSTKHHIASGSFGPSASSTFIVGPRAARSSNRLQVLCARNAKVTHRRSQKTTLHWGHGTATATIKCPRGTHALGNAFPQEFTPGFGKTTSLPGANTRVWKAVVGGLTTNMLGTFKESAFMEPVYADVACVRMSKRKVVTKEFRLDAAGAASGTVRCAGGRKALGWGLELNPFRYRVPSNGGWITPVVHKAQFGATSMQFAFGLPTGSAPETQTPGTKVVAHVVCGTLKA